MPGLVTEAAAARLRQIMAAGRTTPLRPASIPVPGRRSIVVRCTSATAAGGADPIGAEVYPAVVVNAASDELIADQEELGTIWLTLWDGSVPTVDTKYFGMMTGYFDPDPTGTSDSRPRVFATSSSTSDSVTHRHTSATFSITADGAWQDVGTVVADLVLNNPGIYLLFMNANAQVKCTANPDLGFLAVRMYSETNTNVVLGESMVVTTQVNNINNYGSVCCVATLDHSSGSGIPDTLRMEALRNAGPTWSVSRLFGDITFAGTGFSSFSMGYVKVG